MSKISEEKELVLSLRETGLTIPEVANKFNKNIYLVKNRLVETYAPKRVRRTTREL